MDAQRWREVVATFDELVELEPTAQQQRLALIGTSDAELRLRVEELLRADAAADRKLSSLDQVLTPELVRLDARHDPDPLRFVGRTISHFRVIDTLAVGGMGVVYRATDTELHRPIALKFPLTASFDRNARERFLREARAAAALDHPNVCSIHEVGSTDNGELFYAMPLYQGETLKERLSREGALPIAEALSIAKQIASGLAAAHAAGIVHRDLKPANVMLPGDGAVKILDFGLAKKADPSFTDPRGTMGTIAYMAPEQVEGRPVDHRADLWALGVVLYEMLTGQRPFQGEQAIAVGHAIVHEEPPAPSAARGGVSRGADAVVQTLLNKDPDRRHATAGDVASAIDAALGELRGIEPPLPRASAAARTRTSLIRRRVLWGSAAALILVPGGFMVSGALGTGPGASLLARGMLTPSDSMVVADFDIHGADASLGRTIAAVVGTALSQSRAIGIVPDSMMRPALQRMRRSTGEPLVSAVARELAQREGFKAVVEGGLQPLGAGFAMSIRIVSPEGEPLLSELVTTSLEDLPAGIDRVTRRIRGRIGESLRQIRATPPLPQVTSRSIEALRKYAEGSRALGVMEYERAEELLKEAVVLDSTFAMAWWLLSVTYFNAGLPIDLWRAPLARAWHHRDRLPERERYLVEGTHFRIGAGQDRVRAARAYEAGLRIDTGGFANNLGLLYQSRREYARAESLFRWYVSGGSTTQTPYENLSNALYFQGRREEAESVAVETGRRFPSAKRWVRASWYLYNRGLLDSAQLMLERTRDEGDATMRRLAWLNLSALHQVRGRLGEAERARSEAANANLERGVIRDPLGDQLWVAALDASPRERPHSALRKLELVLLRTPAASLLVVSPLQGEPYFIWAARTFARSGRPGRARQVLASYVDGERDTIRLHPVDSLGIHAARGEIALAEGRPLDALVEFRQADRRSDGPVHLSALGLHADVGRAFDRAGMADSAIAAFERYLNTPQLYRLQHDAVYLAPVLQRLGALHEATGNRAMALAYYERFVALWQEADPDLQPRVMAARKRIEALSRKNQ